LIYILPASLYAGWRILRKPVGSNAPLATISEMNKNAYIRIEDWRNRSLQGGQYLYVYVDGIYLRRNWGGEYENMVILVAICGE
jgi:putative transposase